ncbi:hypothetical protein GCM10011571_09120 [Marinithermofilum abyssi]|uniref:Uncharacterized protein n=1 Tax=Marinithermofilum abyssi TaxID=1571185 RepID=A0A8J2VCK8_9BACL|nr:hypothetical protein GCM10011571_09120 [Marinithermofilum abyssi]
MGILATCNGWGDKVEWDEWDEWDERGCKGWDREGYGEMGCGSDCGDRDTMGSRSSKVLGNNRTASRCLLCREFSYSL